MPGPAADRLEALENLDARRGVVGAGCRLLALAPRPARAAPSCWSPSGWPASFGSVTRFLRSGARRAVPAPRRCSTRSRSGRRVGIGPARPSSRGHAGDPPRRARHRGPRLLAPPWRATRVAREGAGPAPRSVGRKVHASTTARSNPAWPSAGGNPARARAWPSRIALSETAAWTAGWSSSRRRVFATVERARPTFEREVLLR